MFQWRKDRFASGKDHDGLPNCLLNEDDKGKRDPFLEFLWSSLFPSVESTKFEEGNLWNIQIPHGQSHPKHALVMF